MSRPVPDPSVNESKLDQRAGYINDLKKIMHVHRQDSFESNFEASTRGDGSEYSDYDDHSFHQSQSYMNETHSPALLAFVEDYILGQRLEILDTCETDEDAASASSSSFASETSFSHEESRVYKRTKTPSNRGVAPKSADSENIEAPITNDAAIDTITTKRSRWDHLLQNLSAAKRKDDLSNQTNSVIFTTKKDYGLVSRPKILAAIKAKKSSKETATKIEERDDNEHPCDASHLGNTFSIEKTNQYPLEESHMEVTKQVLTTDKSMERIGNEANDGRANLPIFEVTDTDHISKVPTDGDLQKVVLSAACQSKGAEQRNPTPINTAIVNTIEDSKVNLSVHTEGVEIPNIPKFGNNSSSPNKCKTENTTGSYFLRGRAFRNERLATLCTGICDESQSKGTQVTKLAGKKVESTTFSKPILCSKCRCALTDTSVCALLTNESFKNISVPFIPNGVSIDANMPCGSSVGSINEEKFNASCSIHENAEENNDATAVEADYFQSLGDKAIEEISNSNNETYVSCEESDPILNQVSSDVCFQKDTSADSDIAKIETTIASGSPSRKSTKATVQIEFKDWAGNDVEIIKESPRKNRLLWMQGVGLNSKNAPIETLSSSRVVNYTEETKETDDVIKVEETFLPSASVCNFEMTSCQHGKKHTKPRYFGRTKLEPEEKSVLISPINMPTSVSEDIDDAASQGNTECSLKPAAESLKSSEVQEENIRFGKELPEENNSFGKQKVPASSSLKVATPSNLLLHDAEEAFILERAMQQVHAEDKFISGNSKTRRHITSPVTLYRFLDFNPCRNELVQGNSYDIAYDPIGLSVCQVPKIDMQTNFSSRKVFGNKTDLKEKTQNESTGSATKSIHQQPGSSLKKVLRRLSKPNKVAFREDLVDVYSNEVEANLHPVPKSMESTNFVGVPVDDSKSEKLPADGPLYKSRNFSTTKSEIADPIMKNSKIAAKDKLKALLSEKSKGTIVSIKTAESVRDGSNKSLGSATKVLAAIKAECIKRRMNKHKTTMQQPASQTMDKKKGSEIRSKLRHANAATILEEFKKAHAAGKLERGYECENPTQEGSDGTIATFGTKQSQISSLSKLTVEEKKLAQRLLNDIQLLAMIEKKRKSMGQVQSSLKSADIEKSVKLLKSIEASRKKRTSQDGDIKPLVEATAEIQVKTPELPDKSCSIKNASVIGDRTSTLSDITSTKKFNK
jgi:hypothetical protein